MVLRVKLFEGLFVEQIQFQKHPGFIDCPFLRIFHPFRQGNGAQGFDGPGNAKELLCDFSLFGGPLVVIADSFGNLCQVTGSRRRNDENFIRCFNLVFEPAGQRNSCPGIDCLNQRLVQIIDPGIVELRCNCSVNRHLFCRPVEKFMVALVLFLHIAQSVKCSTFVELVDRHQVGKIEHVDLFELACRAVFRSHHVERHITVIDNLGIGLPDARSFNDN